MNIVIVKHENCGAKYLFLVPDGKTLNAGDLVRVNTKHGQTLATCLCDSFVVEDETNAKYIANAFGVNEPTAYVVGKFTYDEWNMSNTVENEIAGEIISALKRSMNNMVDTRSCKDE